MADNDSSQRLGIPSVDDVEHPSDVENVHTTCPFCPCVSEDNHADHSDHGEQDTDFLPFQLDSNGIPVNWRQVRLLQQEPYILEELRAGLPEYDKIVTEFSRMNIRVTKIERLQNKRLLDQFKAEEEDIKKGRANDSTPNIRYLYHGTKLEKKRICEEGLDKSSSTVGNRGRGFYLSNKPLKCIHYSGQSDRPDETMILKCRVILDDNQGSKEDLTEYVVQEHRRVMVEYFISFEVDEGIANLIAAAAVHEALDDEHTAGENAVENEHATGDTIGGLYPILVFIFLLAVGFVITPYFIIYVLGALGFAAKGVTAGSIAAIWQSRFGVTRGSWFATAQSTAATGIVSNMTRITGGLVFAAIIIVLMKIFNRRH